VLDAIDADGEITPHGRQMANMPLEPALARALLAAHKMGCVLGFEGLGLGWRLLADAHRRREMLFRD